MWQKYLAVLEPLEELLGGDRGRDLVPSYAFRRRSAVPFPAFKGTVPGTGSMHAR